MNAAGEPRERRALAALVELARDKTRLPTSARLDSGFLAVRRRIDAERRWWRVPLAQMVVWSLVASLVVAAVFVGVSVVRSEDAPPTLSALKYRVEGGSIVQPGNNFCGACGAK